MANSMELRNANTRVATATGASTRTTRGMGMEPIDGLMVARYILGSIRTADKTAMA